jgi:hypothetical protein
MMNMCRRCGHAISPNRLYGEHCEKLVEAGVTALSTFSRKITCVTAAELLREGLLTPVPRKPGYWTVPSSRDPNVLYVVTDHSCTCPAALYTNQATLCRHRLAATVLAA